MSPGFSALVAVALTASPARSVWLDVGPDLPCDLAAGLPASLAAQELAVVRARAEAAWVLTARRDGPAVDVRLGATHRRRFQPSPADCPVLARAVAVLVRSWVDAAPPPSAPARAPKPTAAPTPPPAPLPPEPQPAPVPVPEPEPAAPEVTPPPPLPAARMFEPSPPRTVGPRTRQSVSVLLTGGGAVAPADATVGLARLGLEWGPREPWAVAVDVGFQSLRGSGTADGTVRASLQWASLGGRRAFEALANVELHVAASAQLIRFDAVATGFTTRRRENVFTAGGTLALDVRRPIAAGLFVLARLSLQVRVPQTFSIDGVGPVLSVPAWGAGLEGGIGWNFL